MPVLFWGAGTDQERGVDLNDETDDGVDGVGGGRKEDQEIFQTATKMTTLS